MKQLTIRGFDVELEQRIKRLARREGISLNKAALRLLRAGAGLGDASGTTRCIGTRLDKYVGSMSDEEADELLESVSQFERVDEEMWQ